MLRVRIQKYVIKNGSVKHIESYTLGKPEWESDPLKIRPAGGASLLGEWISDFLSIVDEKIDKYLLSMGFEDAEIADALYIHRVLDSFLMNQPKTLPEFERLLANHGLSVPSIKYLNKGTETVEEYYDCKDISEFCTALLYHALKYGCTFRICRHCYKWFVTEHKTDEKYCTRQSPRDKDKTCRQAARHIQTLKRRHNDEATRLRKNIRQMLDNRGHDKTDFNNQNDDWMRRVKSSEVAPTEYVQWLKSHYKRKQSVESP